MELIKNLEPHNYIVIGAVMMGLMYSFIILFREIKSCDNDEKDIEESEE